MFLRFTSTIDFIMLNYELMFIGIMIVIRVIIQD